MKNEQCNIRISKRELDLASRAADMIGESRPDFIRNAIRERRERVILQHEEREEKADDD